MTERYTKEKVLAWLDSKNIAYHCQHHPAVYTMEDVERAGIERKGILLKNLFLRDGKGKRHFLVSVPETKKVDFKELEGFLGVKKLGMASAERLDKFLGLERGCVSPFGILNDGEKEVTVVFDEELSDNTVVGVHPNDRTASVWLQFGKVKEMAAEHGNSVVLLKFDSLE